MLSDERDDESKSRAQGLHALSTMSIVDLLDGVRERIRAEGGDRSVTIPLFIGDDDQWQQAKQVLIRDLEGEPRPVASVWGEGIECLQCGSLPCLHGLPAQADQVFERYTPNGKPIFTRFADLVLREMPHLSDRLYRSGTQLTTYVTKSPQSSDPLLPAIAKACRSEILAVLKVGFLRSQAFRDETRRAVSILLVKADSRFELRLIGLNDIESSDIRRLPDGDHLRIVEQALRGARRKLKRLMRQRRAKVADQQMSPIAVLNQLGASLRRLTGKGQTRTHHAKKRHAEGDRPTGLAFKDARQVSHGNFLFDERRKTYVVVGRRGRAHLFTSRGKHVTSIRLEKGELERKKQSGRWRATQTSELDEFTSTLSSL